MHLLEAGVSEYSPSRGSPSVERSCLFIRGRIRLQVINRGSEERKEGFHHGR